MGSGCQTSVIFEYPMGEKLYMIKNQQKALFTATISSKKEELEEIRRLLNENVEANGYDYQEILTISRRMDEAIVEFMRMKKKEYFKS